jgi:rhomboid family GlyGly-CTERM serine protease
MLDRSSILNQRLITRWAVPVFAISLCTVAYFYGEGAVGAFGYDRAVISGGEYYRLLTGHLLHLNGSHLAFNLAGFCLVLLISWDSLGAGAWIGAILICASGTGLALYYLNPDLRYYLGLSGLLHGLLIVVLLRTHYLTLALKVVGLLAVSVKLGVDLSSHGGIGIGKVIGGRVLPEAHLYGAISGLIASILFYFIKGLRSAPLQRQ